MIYHINQPIAVGMLLDSSSRTTAPRWIRWAEKTYQVVEVGFHHTVRKGALRIHVFSVNVGTLDMRVEIDGDSLAATLTEVSDGLAD